MVTILLWKRLDFNKMNDSITPTSNSEQISKAPNNALRKALLTCDGVGSKVKEEILNELINRAVYLALIST